MSLPKYKAVGHIGSWFATIGETHYPCVHNHRVRWEGGRSIYVDPGYDSPQPKWVKFIEAFTNEHWAVLTNDKVLGPSSRGANFKRDGYATSCPGRRALSAKTNPRRITPSLRPDLISDRDSTGFTGRE